MAGSQHCDLSFRPAPSVASQPIRTVRTSSKTPSVLALTARVAAVVRTSRSESHGRTTKTNQDTGGRGGRRRCRRYGGGSGLGERSRGLFGVVLGQFAVVGRV